MTAAPRSSGDPVGRAAVEALLAARWECADLLSRRPAPLVPDLLRAHAAELTASPFARDQVLSLALEAAARDLDVGAAPLGQGVMFLFDGESCAHPSRERIQASVRGQPSGQLSGADLAAAFERRLAAERLAPSELSLRLHEEARLQEALWDDPRLVAAPAVRQAMLGSVPRFAERAAQLDPSRRRAARRARARRRVHRGRPSRRSLAKRLAAVRRRMPDGVGWWIAAGVLAVAVAASVFPAAAALQD